MPKLLISNYLTLNSLRGGGGNINIINADFFSHLKFYKHYKTKKPQWQLDFRYPFKCDDDCFDGIFSEHVLEHFYIDDARQILQECYRILKPDCVLRLSIPDLSYSINSYLESKKDKNNAYFGAEYVRLLTQEYLHLSVWDYDRLAYELGSVGFSDVRSCVFRQGSDKNLLFDLESRKAESFYIEAKK